MKAARLCLLLAACGLLAACPADKPAPPRNLLLITIDTLRADALGFAGNLTVQTPNLDRLAAGGRVFTEAHAHNVVTLPSHTNILTGLYPYQHGVRDNGGFVLREEVPTLASILSREGFATAAFVGAYPLAARFGLTRGFSVYDEVKVGKATALVGGLPDPRKPFGERPGTEVVEKALAWWKANEGKNRFLWIHLFDPHSPYLPPEPFASRYPHSRYHGEVAAVDAYLEPLIGPLMAAAKPDTLVALTGDHGESLGEHGERAHGLFAYEATLKIPLLLWGPGTVEPGRDDWPTRHIDMMPTLLAALGKNAPEGLPGRDLLGPRDLDPRQVDAYFESLSTHLNNGWAPLRGLTRDRWKVIEVPIPELYNLAEDPHETRNLFADERRQARTLLEALPALSQWPPDRGQLSSEEEAQLRALGYLVGEAKKSSEFGPADDPKTLAPLQVELQEMVRTFHEGNLEDAMARCRKILAQRADTGMALTYLSVSLIRSGRQPEAIALMRQAVKDKVASADLRRQLGLSLLWSGQPQEAMEVLSALAVDSPDVTTLNNLALAWVALERADLAIGPLDTSLGQDPTDAGTLENYAYVLLQLNDAPGAEVKARAALEIEPTRVGALNNLALSLYHQRRHREAVDAWRRAAELDPGNLDTLFNLGTVAAEIGAPDIARPALRRFLERAPPGAAQAQRQAAAALLRQLG